MKNKYASELKTMLNKLASYDLTELQRHYVQLYLTLIELGEQHQQAIAGSDKILQDIAVAICNSIVNTKGLQECGN